MNHLVRQYWEQGTHIILIDIGNSYKGLCDLIHQRTNGEDGVYYTYSEKRPIAFNPFFTEDKVFDLEKKESIKTLIMSLWKRDTELITRAEEVALSMAVNLFLEKIKEIKNWFLLLILSTSSYRESSVEYWRRSITARRISISLTF